MEYEEEEYEEELNTSEVDWGDGECEPQAEFQENESWSGEETNHYSWRREEAHETETWHDLIDSHICCGEERGYKEELAPESPSQTWSSSCHVQPQTKIPPISWELQNRATIKRVQVRFDYHKKNVPKPFEFSGYRGVPTDYSQWEERLDAWFLYHRVPKGEKLAYALGLLTGEAYKWWRGFNADQKIFKKPTITNWEQLKWIMRDTFAHNHSHGVSSYKAKSQSALAASKRRTKEGSDYTSNPLVFTGSSKDPEVYLRWETNMKQWLRSHNIPKEDKLDYALSMLKGEAYRWWLKEDAATYYTSKPILDWGTLKSRMYREFAKKYQATPTKVVTSKPRPTHEQRTISHMNGTAQVVKTFSKAACMSGTRKAPPISLGKRLEAKQATQTKDVQQELVPQTVPPRLSSKALREQQGNNNQGKSSELSKSKEIICYRCHQRGHFAATCPTRELINPTTQELKPISLKSCDSLGQQDLKFSNSSLLHLSLPKVVDTGPNHMMKHTNEDMSRIGATCGLDPKAQHQGAIKDHKELENFSALAQEKVQSNMLHSVLNASMTNIMHLSLAKSVEDISGTNEEHMEKKLLLHQIQTQGATTSILTRLETTNEEAETDTSQLKEEPPDAPRISKQIAIQGKVLPSKNRMKANLLSLGADYTVSRSKLLEERGYDEVILAITCQREEDGKIKPEGSQGSSQTRSQRGFNTAEMTPEQYSTWPNLKINLENSTTNFGVIYSHLESISKWNHLITSSYEGDMNFTSLIVSSNPELDIRALFGVQLTDQKELGYKPNYYEILTHQGGSEILNHFKPTSYEELIEFSIHDILHLPHFEVDDFGRTQQYSWRPGELLHQLEDPRRYKGFPFDPGTCQYTSIRPKDKRTILYLSTLGGATLSNLYQGSNG